MKHAMVKMLCSGELFFAPIGKNPQEILDIGTGTGIWAIESKCEAGATGRSPKADVAFQWATCFRARRSLVLISALFSRNGCLRT